MTPKTQAGNRTLPLPEFAVEALREHLAAQTDDTPLLFPSPEGGLMQGTRFLKNHFRPVLRKANLAQMPFHDLRHSVATMLYAMDVDIVTISKILGHASPATTVRIYGHATLEMKQRAIAKLQGAIGGTSNGIMAATERQPAEPNGSQMAAKSQGTS